MAKPATPESVRRSYQAQKKIVARLEHSVTKARKTLSEKEVPLRVAQTRLDHIANTPVFDEAGNLVQVDREFLETPPTPAEAAAEATEGTPEGGEGTPEDTTDDTTPEGDEDVNGTSEASNDELTFA